MSDHQSYITLDSVVKDCLTEGDYSQHAYFKCWHLAFRGMDNLGIDFFYKVQSVKLPVNANFTVTLPSDYLNWTKVGILNNNGAIIPLYYNPNMTTYADLDPNRIEKTDDGASQWMEWGLNTWFNYWSGYMYTNIYGVPSGEPFVGEFKIDLDNGVILLNKKFNRDYIMLEYLCSPKEGNNYYIPVQFREALIAWITWKNNKSVNIRRGQVGIMNSLKEDFYRERRNAIAQWKPSRIFDKYQASQEQTRLAVKT